MRLADWLERSRLWQLGRLAIPGSTRKRACVRRGTHAPELIDLGRAKMCRNCGAW